MKRQQEQSLECEFCVKLDFKHLAFIDYNRLSGNTFSTYNDAIMELNEEVVEWLRDNHIEYSFIFVRTISNEHEDLDEFHGATRAETFISFYLEFRNIQDLSLFKLTWC